MQPRHGHESLNGEDRHLSAHSSVAEILQEERSLYSTQFTLGFRSLQFIPELEEEFRAFYLENNPGQLRRLLPVAVALTVMFLFSDYMRTDWDTFSQVLIPRVAQLGALVMMTIVIFGEFKRVMEVAVVIALAAYGISTPIIMGIINNNGLYSPIAAQLFIIAFCYFLTGLRFFPAMIASLIVSVSYPASQVLFDAPLANMAHNSYLIMAFNVLGIFGAYFFEYTTRENFLSRQLMREMALYDSVTGLLNQRAATMDVDKICRQARRESSCVTVAMVDVDNFKEFNEYFGYAQGDYCLRKVASALRSAIRRPLDVGGRYGGEEFVIAWYGCDNQHARVLAEQARSAVESLAIPHGPSSSQRCVTVSIGIASSKTGEIPDCSTLLRSADRALATAKERGKNRIAGEGDNFNPKPI